MNLKCLIISSYIAYVTCTRRPILIIVICFICVKTLDIKIYLDTIFLYMHLMILQVNVVTKFNLKAIRWIKTASGCKSLILDLTLKNYMIYNL
jgi:hypothetical protein